MSTEQYLGGPILWGTKKTLNIYGPYSSKQKSCVFYELANPQKSIHQK